jgi:PAS domain-containing protein
MQLGGVGGSHRLAVCTLLDGPTEQPPPRGAAPTPAPTAAPTPAPAPRAPGTPPPPAGLHAVPLALSQLCNQALASTSEGVVITDPSQPGNPIVWANAAFERMTGYSLATVLGRGHSLLQGPDTDPGA